MALVKWAAVIGLLVGLSACGGGEPPTSLLTPATRQDPVYVENTELLQLESFPVQVVLQVSGQLPDPCHEAVWSVSEPDLQGRIDVELHSEAPDGLDCIQVLKPVTLRIPIGSFKEGSYTIWLNSEQVESFDLPA
jgi:hypothetical protein